MVPTVPLWKLTCTCADLYIFSILIQIGLAYGLLLVSRSGFQKVESLLSLQSTLPPPVQTSFHPTQECHHFHYKRRLWEASWITNRFMNLSFSALLIIKSKIVDQVDENEYVYYGKTSMFTMAKKVSHKTFISSLDKGLNTIWNNILENDGWFCYWLEQFQVY